MSHHDSPVPLCSSRAVSRRSNVAKQDPAADAGGSDLNVQRLGQDEAARAASTSGTPSSLSEPPARSTRASRPPSTSGCPESGSDHRVSVSRHRGSAGDPEELHRRLLGRIGEHSSESISSSMRRVGVTSCDEMMVRQRMGRDHGRRGGSRRRQGRDVGRVRVACSLRWQFKLEIYGHDSLARTDGIRKPWPIDARARRTRWSLYRGPADGWPLAYLKPATYTKEELIRWIGAGPRPPTKRQRR